MRITILGCWAATPRTLTNPTSQVLEINNQMFLIDCGEGTQVQLRKHKIKFSKINHIFISHLHGDHFYGLIGLISTFSMLGRKTDLHVYGPKGIKEIILLQLRISDSFTGYNLYFHELDSNESEVIYEDDKITVATIPLIHRVYTNGYLFTEKPKERKINIEKVAEHKIESCYMQRLKNGDDIILDSGDTIPNNELTNDPDLPQSYAFCSDTLYNENIIPIINGVTTLYHESTFLESESRFTFNTKHSTAKEAATIALKANAKHLILGHYSTRYPDINLFKTEAEEIFNDVHLAEDGKVLEF